ncbi:MAG: tetratricopeptide repeat protein [Candidatus Schekmanbacteria bacterium]|nr:tetratricopeptide repeat protein [Candidatus Schekmanbacteria bacterium]
MPSPDEYCAEGKKLLATGRLDLAAKAFSDALQADHQHLEASLALARIAIALRKIEQARAIVDRVIGFSSTCAEAHVLRGLLREGTGDHDGALESFAIAVGLDGGSYEARYQHGRSLAAAKRFKDAVRELNHAARLDPRATDPHYALGIAYKQSGDHAAAVAEFAKTIEINPAYLDGYMTLADVLSEVERQDGAEKVLLQAKSLFPDAGVVYDKLAAVYLKKGDLQKVVSALREQTRIDPDNEAAYVNLATFALAATDVETAAAAVDKLLARDPDNWRGLHLRSMLYDMGNRADLAITDLRHAMRVAPQEWRPYNDLGTLLNAQARTNHGIAQEAVAVLESACRLAPQGEFAPRFNLALAYWNDGRPQQARETADALVQSGPAGNPIVEQARQVVTAIDSHAG